MKKNTKKIKYHIPLIALTLLASLYIYSNTISISSSDATQLNNEESYSDDTENNQAKSVIALSENPFTPENKKNNNHTTLIESEDDITPNELDEIMQLLEKHQAFLDLPSSWVADVENAIVFDGDQKQKMFSTMSNQFKALSNDMRITAAESMTLHAWAASKLLPTEQQENVKQELLAYYQEKANQSYQAHQRRLERPFFKAYKEQEKKVAEEVLAMQSYPDGMTQSQYLSMRLHQLRLTLKEQYGE